MLLKLLLLTFLSAVCFSQECRDKIINPDDDTCYLGPIEKGQSNSCFGAFKTYTYDCKTGKCKTFLYGGCHGTKNLFNTLGECKKTCVSNHDDDICNLGPLKKGQVNNCSGAFKKYTYDYKTGKCKKFLYSGCHGSKNLFDTFDECKRACVSKCGKCPDPKGLGICANACASDWDCQGDDKCCRTWCGGAICVTPEKCCACGQSSKKSIKLVTKNGKNVAYKKKSKKTNKYFYDWDSSEFY